ncbi:DNA-directed RNA polymerase, 18 kD subunit [Carp edema virus]|nr:DNA-directed RNA polymerase, 18 kD subunit [Carp edema virus]
MEKEPSTYFEDNFGGDSIGGARRKVNRKSTSNSIISLPTNSTGAPLQKKRGRPRKNPESSASEALKKQEEKPEEKEEIVEQAQRSLEDIFNVEDRSAITVINANSFRCNDVVDVKLKPSEVGIDLIKNIKKYIRSEYLNWEIRGKMMIDFELDPNMLLPLANIWMDYVTLRIPIHATFKIYRIGDVIESTLNFTKENELYIRGDDIICFIYKENGTISYKNDKICYKRGKLNLFENDLVKIKIKNIETSTKVHHFICNGVLDMKNENLDTSDINV